MTQLQPRSKEFFVDLLKLLNDLSKELIINKYSK